MATEPIPTRPALPTPVDAGIQDPDQVQVEAFGAVGDCTTDDAPAIQAAIAHATANGSHRVQLGSKCYRWGSAVSITSPIRLQGAGWSDTGTAGTRLHITGTGYVPLTLSGPGASGTEIRDVQLQQDQPPPGLGWAPTVYPPAFVVSNVNGRIVFDNVFAFPIYDLISASYTQRLQVDHLYGHVLHNALREEWAYDTSHIGTIHLWPYWSQDVNVVNWSVANADQIVLGRVDGFVAQDLFTFGARSCVKLVQSPTVQLGAPGGNTSNLDITALYCDSTKWPIWVTAPSHGDDRNSAFGHIGGAFLQGQQFNDPNGTPIPDSTGLLVDAGAAVNLHIDSFRAERFESNAVRVSSTSAPTILRFGAFDVRYINSLSNGSAAVSLASPAPGLPHEVAFGTPPRITLSSGAFLLNASNALVIKPGGLSAIQPAATGTAYQIPNSTPFYVLSASTPLVEVTLNLPLVASEGVQEIVSSVDVAKFTLNAAPGQTLSNAPTALTAHVAIRLVWVPGAATWQRLQ
ncbi:MAG: hypothetical protein ACRYG8_15040 [Janthinobacterium lividum]